MFILAKTKIFLIFSFCLLFFIVGSVGVFAEGDTVCKGRITGKTTVYNSNSGILNFNSHQGPGLEDNEAVSLSIVGLGSGLAPANRSDAACIEKESGTFGGESYDYNLKGWAWNTNGGFTSFNCVNISCGNIDYGVYISPKDGNGERKLFGYAWNPTYGWLQFKGSGIAKANSGNKELDVGNSMVVNLAGVSYTVSLLTNNFLGESTVKVDSVTKSLAEGATVNFGAVNLMAVDSKYLKGPGPHLTFVLETVNGQSFDYGVKTDSSGKTSGYAWSQAGIYLDFSGLTLNLPDEAGGNQVVGKNWCDSKPFLCVQIDTDVDDIIVISPFDLALGAGGDKEVKIADGKDGYFIHLYFRDKDGKGINPDVNNNFIKNLTFNWKDTVKIDQVSANNTAGDTLNNISKPWSQVNGKGAVTFKPLTFSDFSQVFKSGVKDTGHFISKKITAYAPTSESKFSYTTSTKPTYLVNNEDFFYKPQGLSVDTLEKNLLILKSITFPDLVDNNGNVLLKAGAVYPNGKIDMPFKFKPAVIVDPLYANDLQDTILGYRSVPINFKTGVKLLGDLVNLAKDPLFKGGVQFKLTYSQEETLLQPDCSGPDVKKDFVFKFLNDFSNNDLTNKQPAVVDVSDSIVNLIKNQFDIQAIAQLPDYNSDDPSQLPCAVAKGSNLYTVVGYQISGKNIIYFDNKLPRIAGDAILNPVVVVHGNIYSQVVGTVRADERVQTSGAVNMNLVRDAIDENLWKYADKAKVNNLKKNNCNIMELKDQAGGIIGTVGCVGTYTAFDVVTGINTEHVLYFKGTNVTLELDDGIWNGRWVIVVDGGNIFVDSNLYDPDDDNAKLSLIAFRDQDDYFSTGNIYIAPCSKKVKNIEVTIVADGSIFSYDGNVADIDSTTGEPKWASYRDMVNFLNCQLVLKGAISSDNTIGGANLDQGTDPKNYLLSGGGKIIKLPASLNDRMQAQYYDLNYLRMFRLDLELTPEGLPIDQKCGKGWTAEDQKNLMAGQTVCGEKNPCDMNGGMEQPNACNGINPLSKYDVEKPDGDLIVPSDGLLLDDGLNKDTDFEPVYIYYIAPDTGSFVFSKKGAINVWGK